MKFRKKKKKNDQVRTIFLPSLLNKKAKNIPHSYLAREDNFLGLMKHLQTERNYELILLNLKGHDKVMVAICDSRDTDSYNMG